MSIHKEIKTLEESLELFESFIVMNASCLHAYTKSLESSYQHTFQTASDQLLEEDKDRGL